MIVRVFRPVNKPGPWVIYPRGGPAEMIEPTEAMVSALEGTDGYFEAEQTDDGWIVGRRMEDQRW